MSLEAKKRIAAGVAAAILYFLGTWFVAWDQSPAEWGTDTRLFVMLGALGAIVIAASAPFWED